MKDINKLNVDYYGQRFYLSYYDWLPFIKNNYKYSNRMTYILNCSTDNFENIYSTYSTQIRNKIKNKHKIEVNLVSNFENLEQYYALIELSLLKHNKTPKYTKKDFIEFIKESINNDSCLLFEAKLNGKILAVSIFLYDSNYIYYYLAGEDKKFSECNAPTILLNQAIKYACEKQLDLDFCGSMIDSLSSYYECFGADRKSVLIIEKDNNSSFNESLKINIKSSF